LRNTPLPTYIFFSVMKPTILIIDDENDFCEIMKNYFTKKGYNVSLAYTLKEGMAILKEGRPEILFLDNNLPDGQGWDVMDEIVEIIPQIRAFLISAHKNRFISKINNPGYNIVVWEKPISFSELDRFF
jgi:DNA-binding NtrC family response regulator